MIVSPLNFCEGEVDFVRLFECESSRGERFRFDVDGAVDHVLAGRSDRWRCLSSHRLVCRGSRA